MICTLLLHLLFKMKNIDQSGKDSGYIIYWICL